MLKHVPPFIFSRTQVDIVLPFSNPSSSCPRRTRPPQPLGNRVAIIADVGEFLHPRTDLLLIADLIESRMSFQANHPLPSLWISLDWRRSSQESPWVLSC